MSGVNDFAFKIATANGTGSASANGRQLGSRIQSATAVIDGWHAPQLLGGAHLHVQPRLGEHAAELLGLVGVARRQVDIHGRNVTMAEGEGKEGGVLR